MYNFKLGTSETEIVEKYRYLGIVQGTAVDFTITVVVLADSAGSD